MILGAVLAGGQSSRFGSDKANARLHGETLLERAIASLSSMCSSVVVVGRTAGSGETLEDWPRAGMGPLGGIAAALRHADSNGFDSVLSCGVDSSSLPDDLNLQLGPPPSYVASQPVIGHWPASAREALEAILSEDGRHSMLRFAKTIGAREVRLSVEPDNINTPADLAAAENSHDV